MFSLDSGAVVGMQLGVLNSEVRFADGLKEPARVVVPLFSNQFGVRPLAYNAGIADVTPATHIVALLGRRSIRYQVRQ